LPADEFAALVGGAAIERVADVRRFPGSRRFPQFGASMPTWLADHGLDYQWMESLGGRRAPASDSPNVALRDAGFRGYADYMASSEFAAGVAALLTVADRPTVVMCAESVWWRCHRRLLADHLVLVDQVRVEHLFHDGRLAEHSPTPEARRVDDHLVYDVNAQRSLLD